MSKFVALILFVSYSAWGAQKISGNLPEEDSASFSFPVGSFAFETGRIYLGAAKSVKNNEFALSFVDRGGTGCAALAVPKAIINGQENQENPLYGAAITDIAISLTRPLLVTKEKSDQLFLIQNFVVMPQKRTNPEASNVEITASPLVNDANGKVTSGIIGLGSDSLFFYAAVKPHKGAFGKSGSGIALGHYLESSLQAEKKEDSQLSENKALLLLNAQTGTLEGNKAASLTIHSNSVKVGGSARSILNERINLEVGPRRVYAPLQVIGGDGERDGVCGLVMGHLFNVGKMLAEKNRKKIGRKKIIEKQDLQDTRFQQLILKKALLDSAIGYDSIIAAKGPGAHVSLYYSKLMNTSTNLNYVIGVGGARLSSDDAKRTVFALPLVNNIMQPKTFGLVAATGQAPLAIFKNGVFVSRFLENPASVPSDIPALCDARVQVGAGKAPAPVKDISAYNDAVFISTSKSGDGQLPGIFHSQAIFESNGCIQSWTPWRRVSGADTAVTKFALDGASTQWLYLTTSDQDSSQNTVKRTRWDSGQQNDDSALSLTSRMLFDSYPGGIQQVNNYNYDQKGFSRQQGSRIALLTMTGDNRVVIVQTGKDHEKEFGPKKTFTGHFTSTDGSLVGFQNSVSLLDIQGGELSSLGSIVASAIVTDNENGWLVVGGTGGIAVLARPDGTGWKISKNEGLSSGFVGLFDDMRFIKIGHSSDVHKFVAVENHLYVGSLYSLHTLTLSPELIKQSHDASFKLLFDTKLVDERVSVLDYEIVDNVAFVATNIGLFESSLLCSIAGVSWNEVDVPYGPGGVTRLQLIEGNKRANIIALCGSPSNNQSRVYRYEVVKNDGVARLKLFNDFFTQDAGSMFLFTVHRYRGYAYTDGALFYLTGTPFAQLPQAVDVIFKHLSTLDQKSITDLTIPLRLPEALTVGSISRESGSGASYIFTNKAILLNS